MDTILFDRLKELISDFQVEPLITGVPRDLAFERVPRKAAICIGVRRCGKSTLLFQQMQRLLEQGVSRRNLVYLNFFDDRLHALRSDTLGLVSEAYYSLYPEKKGTEKVFFFFDEVQCVPGWEAYVDRLLRTEKCEVFLSGSSAQMLSKEIATQMRGRSLAWELFPFSFVEFLRARKLTPSSSMTSRERLLIRKAFEAYLETGGFPEVLDLTPHLRVKTHQEYLTAILFRDVIERHDISSPKAVDDLAHWLIDNTASLYSANKLTGYLKALGHKVPKATVGDILGWFEDTYFLFTVRIFDASLARSNTNPKKIYCVDHALVQSVASGVLVNSGHLLENLVFMSLRREHADIFYYKTRSGREVDFVIPMKGGAVRLVQVCETLARPETRKRECQALADAMGELRCKTVTLVTLDEEGEERVASGVITITPAWRFLLEGRYEADLP